MFLGHYYNGNLSANSIIPKRRRFNTYLKELVIKDHVIIKAKLHVALMSRGVGMTIDIWTDRRMINSYLSITAHWFEGAKLHDGLLAFSVWPVTQSKTAESIKEKFLSVLSQYELTSRANRILVNTDRGANIDKLTYKL